MKIKDELVLNGMASAAAENIEYNTIGAFQTINSKTPKYFIVRWTTLVGNTLSLLSHMKSIIESLYLCNNDMALHGTKILHAP